MKATRLATLVLLPLLLISCSVGRRMVPQSDIDAYEVGKEVFDTRILLASRDSDFKVDVARRIGESLKDEPVYVKFIGIDQLDDEDVSQYSAIVIMTKCIAWGLDPETSAFLDKNPELSNIVVLITSGNGDWKPDMEGMKFDAVTSASVLENAGSITEEILEKVHKIVDTEA